MEREIVRARRVAVKNEVFILMCFFLAGREEGGGRGGEGEGRTKEKVRRSKEEEGFM